MHLTPGNAYFCLRTTDTCLRRYRTHCAFGCDRAPMSSRPGGGGGDEGWCIPRVWHRVRPGSSMHGTGCVCAWWVGHATAPGTHGRVPLAGVLQRASVGIAPQEAPRPCGAGPSSHVAASTGAAWPRWAPGLPELLLQGWLNGGGVCVSIRRAQPSSAQIPPSPLSDPPSHACPMGTQQRFRQSKQRVVACCQC